MVDLSTCLTPQLAFAEFSTTIMYSCVRWRCGKCLHVNRRHGQTSSDNCHSPKSDGESLYILHGDWCCKSCGVNNFARQAVCFIKCYTPEQLWNNLSAIHPKQPYLLLSLKLQLFVLIPNLRRKVLSDFNMIPTKATNFFADSLLEEIQHVCAEQFSISVTVFKY